MSVLHKHSWPQNSIRKWDTDDSKIQLGICYTSIETNKLCLRVEFRRVTKFSWTP